jgi:hypothetical protein
MPDKLTMTVGQDGATGRLQLAIHKIGPDGAGHGYRIAGPKFTGTGRTLLTRELTAEDAAEIRRYLDSVFPAVEADDPCPADPREYGEREPEWPRGLDRTGKDDGR